MTAPLEGVQARTVYYQDMSIGQSESFSHIVREEDIAAFAAVSGDHNPIHTDKDYGQASQFGSNIAHGLYTASLFSALLGMRLPGPGAIYLSQTLKFSAPVRVGDKIDVAVTINEMIDRGRRVVLKCEARVGNTLVLSGEATVVAPKKPA
ncbi:MaoC family dehydratase [Cohaesibacter celericrescens]|uniref:MaoC family dehydratase n=1 Tax=Cohaesibacter celericrescens TaxID=2067669 RepID=UPI0035648618